MPTTSQQQGIGSVQQREQRYEQVDSQQAQARLTSFPAQMAYEAKYALQTVKEIASDQGADTQQVIEIVEPLARAVGWAEALSFAFTKITERDAVEHMAQSGLLSK